MYIFVCSIKSSLFNRCFMVYRLRNKTSIILLSFVMSRLVVPSNSTKIGKKTKKVKHVQSTVPEQVKTLAWIMGNVKDLDPEEDNISVTESSERLFLLGLSFGIFLALISTLLAIQFTRLLDLRVIFYEIKITNENIFKSMPSPHIIFMASNGTLFQTKLLKNEKLEKISFLFRLPKVFYKKYFMFQSQPKVMDFVRNDLKINIIQLLSNGEDQIIPKSENKQKLPDLTQAEIGLEWYFETVVQVGDKVWFLFPDDVCRQVKGGFISVET